MTLIVPYYISLHPDIFLKLEGYIKKVRDSDQRLLRSTYYADLLYSRSGNKRC